MMTDPVSFKNVFIDFRERGREGEREWNISVREKHLLVASHTHPDQGSNPATCVPWPELKPYTSGVQDDAPANWATLARAWPSLEVCVCVCQLDIWGKIGTEDLGGEGKFIVSLGNTILKQQNPCHVHFRLKVTAVSQHTKIFACQRLRVKEGPFELANYLIYLDVSLGACYGINL